jgi:hypothetical protein
MYPLAKRVSRATRRRLLACAAAIVLALPAEAALLAMITANGASARDAALEWAESLDADDLQDAAQRIQEFPYFYRRAIMTALEPADRAIAWRRYLTTYAATHQLDTASKLVLTRAVAAMTPEVFEDGAPADQLAELAAVFDIAAGIFGRDTAIDLFMRLGPDTNSAESLRALPIAERVSVTLRGWLHASANTEDCDCTTAFGASCDVAGLTGAEVCATASGCEPDLNWPMSGVAWAFPSNGVCTSFPAAAPRQR